MTHRKGPDVGDTHADREPGRSGGGPAATQRSALRDAPLGVQALLRLQASAGNAAVAHRLQRPVVQRAVDPAKAKKIDDILNHSIGWVELQARSGLGRVGHRPA